MARAGLIRDMQTPGTPDEQIAALVEDFQQNPRDFFREEELHARFLSRCREAFPRYPTWERHEVATVRHHYDTIWRYKRGDRFAQRYRMPAPRRPSTSSSCANTSSIARSI